MKELPVGWEDAQGLAGRFSWEIMGVVWGSLWLFWLEIFPLSHVYLAKFSVSSVVFFISIPTSFWPLLPAKQKENHNDSKVSMNHS